MQVVGVLVCIGLGAVTAFVLSFVLERTTGLRVSDDEQAEGLDIVNWGIQPDVAPVLEYTTGTWTSGNAQAEGFDTGGLGVEPNVAPKT
jgi:hypothetical protein